MDRAYLGAADSSSLRKQPTRYGWWHRGTGGGLSWDNVAIDLLANAVYGFGALQRPPPLTRAALH